MQLPFFYINNYSGENRLELDEDTSRHIVQVLRMKKGEGLILTDGKGNRLEAVIGEEHKKHCGVEIIRAGAEPRAPGNVTIAISLLKNSSRFEWFLEKATELGVKEIVPLICERTEKQKSRHDRMKQICISAMLQSRQCWLPVLGEGIKYIKYIEYIEYIEYLKSESRVEEETLRLIAHCGEGEKKPLVEYLPFAGKNIHILIGPEGDFTPGEIATAIQHGFRAVTLGQNRLRTETAAVAAAVFLQFSSFEKK